MRVTVFGATGGIGRRVVDQLLTAGQQVTAAVRTPGKLDTDRDRLTVAVGELSDPRRPAHGDQRRRRDHQRPGSLTAVPRRRPAR